MMYNILTYLVDHDISTEFSMSLVDLVEAVLLSSFILMENGRDIFRLLIVFSM